MLNNRIWIIVALLLTLYVKVSAVGVFYLVDKQKKTHIYIDKNEKSVVKTSLEMFSGDMNSVAGSKIFNANKYITDDNLIIAGTIGCNRFIDSLIQNNLITVQEIENKWEGFKIITYLHEKSNKRVLLVIGSDSRGTAYGILELSRMAGVSPWNWWADVTPIKKKFVTVDSDINIVQFPSVQYRGIFLNDEDWGLMPWATKTFDKTSAKGAIGPIVYQKIFELLLRLRANTIWPAMHEATVPFFLVPGNKEIAERYGIVVGTSHCEPMMRCSASEWHMHGKGEYNYATNSDSVNQYWEERVKQLATSENIYTLGMRGVHDGEMLGAKTVAEQVDLTNKVLKNQRKLISDYLNPNVKGVPQVFIPYKEVLEIYNTGKLDLPEDISLIWCDDNFGYISRLSTPQEQARSGGSGVYYHASYWGSPHDYLWLCSTPPTQVYVEMKRAWDYNARKMWILNVGDIKPAEYVTELFLDMAWNINCINEKTIQKHTQNWIIREFGEKSALEISNIMQQYYHLATIRKPEHMGWNRIQTSGFPKGLTPVIDTEFNYLESCKRISDYQKIEDAVEQMSKKINPDRKDAFFQLVKYPVQGASLLNKKLLYAQRSRFLASFNLPAANTYADLCMDAYNKIDELTKVYNTQISNGKWNRMMDDAPRNLPVFAKQFLKEVKSENDNGLLVFMNNELKPLKENIKSSTYSFVKSDDQPLILTLCEKSNIISNWEIINKPDWLSCEIENKLIKGETKLKFYADWNKIRSKSLESVIELKCGNDEYELPINVIKKTQLSMKCLINNSLVLNAENYSKSSKQDTVRRYINLGHSGCVVQLPVSESSALEYNFYSPKIGSISIVTCLYPNHAAIGNQKRYAIAIDNEIPQIINTEPEIFKEDWKVNVLQNQSRTKTIHYISKVGPHTIKIFALDKGVVLDQLLLKCE